MITYWENLARKVDPLCLVISSYRIIPTDNFTNFSISSYTCATAEVSLVASAKMYERKSQWGSQKSCPFKTQFTVRVLRYHCLSSVTFSCHCSFQQKRLRKTIYWLKLVVRLARIEDIPGLILGACISGHCFTFYKVSKWVKNLKLWRNRCNVMETLANGMQNEISSIFTEQICCRFCWLWD